MNANDYKLPCGMELRVGAGRELQKLFAQQPENKRQNTGEDYAGGEGKVKGEVIPFYIDVAGEAAKPGKFAGEGDDGTKEGNKKADDDERFAESWHWKSSVQRVG